MNSYTFKKAERLCSKTLIDKLFVKGNRVVTQFPFRIIWQLSQLHSNEFPAQVMVTVSKRSFARSTQRNKIKRQIRELYRLHKHELYQTLEQNQVQVILSVSYQGKQLLEHGILLAAYQKVLKKLCYQINSLPKPIQSSETPA